MHISGHRKENVDIWSSQHGLTVSKSCQTSLIDWLLAAKLLALWTRREQLNVFYLEYSMSFWLPQHKTLISWNKSSGWPPRWSVAAALAETEGAGLVQPGEGTTSMELKSCSSTPTRRLSRRLIWLFHSASCMRDNRLRFKQERFSLKQEEKSSL